MQKVSFDLIEQASEEINNLNDDHVDALIEQFGQEQPVIMTYLMAIYGDELNEEERELLFFVGIKLWYAIRKLHPQMPLISEEDVESAEADNDDMLNYLSAESDEGFEDFADNLLESYPQSDLLTFALAGIMEDEVEPESESDYARGAMFVVLKTVLDCFDRKL